MPPKKTFKLFGIITIADLLFIALAVVFILVALRFGTPQTVAARPNDVTVTFTVELARRPPGLAGEIETGVPVFDTLRGIRIGTVVGAYERPYSQNVPCFETNIMKRAEVDGLVNVMVVIEASASYSVENISVGTYELFVGREVFMHSKDFSSQGFILMLDVER
jgi:hypothetical protein